MKKTKQLCINKLKITISWFQSLKYKCC